MLLHLYQVGVGSAVLLGVLFAIAAQHRQGVSSLSLIFIILSASIVSNSFLHLYIRSHHINTININDPFLTLLGPALYWHLSYVRGDVRGLQFWLLHGALSLLIAIAVLLVMISATPPQTLGRMHFPFLILSLIVYFQILLYFILCRRALQRYRNQLKQQCSTLERLNEDWLSLSLLTLFIAYGAITLVYSVNHAHIRVPVNQSLSVILALMVYVFGIGILRRPELLRGIPLQPQEQIDKQKKYNHSIMDKDALRIRFEKLERHMRQSMSYKDSELTLSTLARQVGLSSHQLSEVINRGANVNFYDYVNSYRVEAVTALLADRENAGRNILDLAFEAGFNSKASFNRIFKNATGISPSLYRKQQ